MDKHKIYLVPALSLFIIVMAMLFFKPSITGFTVASPVVDANLSLVTSEKDFLPEDALVSVSFNNKQASMSVKEFIENSGQEVQYQDGENLVLNYKGMGYTGNHIYYLSLSAFDLNTTALPGSYVLSIKVSHNNLIISEKSEEILV